MAKRSTTSALICVDEDCLLTLDQGHEICVVFFDVAKAFDTVPHLDLQRLSELGLDPYLIRWISCERSQFVSMVLTPSLVEPDRSHPQSGSRD